MATVLRSLRLVRYASKSLACRPIGPRYSVKPFLHPRQFSSTPSQFQRRYEEEDEDDDDEDDEDDDEEDDDDEYDDDYRRSRGRRVYGDEDDAPLWEEDYEEKSKVPEDPEVVKLLEKADKGDRDFRERRRLESQLDRVMDSRHREVDIEDMIMDNDALGTGEDPSLDRWEQMEAYSESLRNRRNKKGKQKVMRSFLNMGEDEVLEEEGDDALVDDNDDYANMGVLAHFELEQHREWRTYARLAAWDLPLLSKLCKPFEPPTADMPLRFRYTTYLGEHHPAAKKVVLEFCPEDLPDLTAIQRDKLRKICGPRYNPKTDIVKISSEMYESQAQNKRYLGDRVDELMKEAKDPTDTFEDVPLDTRHHKWKEAPKFPAKWKMTQQRKARLELLREDRAVKDELRMLSGSLVNGVQHIENSFAASAQASIPIPEMVMAGKGRMKTVAVRR